MLASVVVCTRNRARRLERLLESLAAQTIRPETFEIIVVDDHSEDETPSTCRKWRERFDNMVPVRLERHSGIGAAGNRAIARATGQFLLFIDDDCIADPGWLEGMIQTLETAPIAAGAIRSPTANYFQLCHNIAQFHPFLMPGPVTRRLEFIAGANLGVRRDVMTALDGFNAATPIPDMEWILRARQRGFTIAFAPRGAITHDPDRYSCRAILTYAGAHASHSIQLRNHFAALLHTPRLFRSPLFLRLASPLIALFITAAIYARNRQLWRRAITFPVVFLAKVAWCWGAARGLRGGKADFQ
jgi:glycosyltransferase involved in cell wall biosynthesis